MAANWSPGKQRAYMKEYYRANPEKFKYDPTKSKHKTEHVRKRQSIWWRSNPAKLVIYNARNRGVPITDSEETVQWYLDNQKECQVCGRKDSGINGGKLHLDHDHMTGRVRGMLCNRCNMCCSTAEHAKKVYEYLLKHEQKV